MHMHAHYTPTCTHIHTYAHIQHMCLHMHPHMHTHAHARTHTASSLCSITLYPVKSCAGFKVQWWPVGEKGLMWDREWMVRSEGGHLLSQKQHPKLCLIHPSVDLEAGTLTLAAKGNTAAPTA